MHRLTFLLILLCTTLSAYAQRKEKHPAADIKVSYNYHQIFLRGGKEVTERDIPMLLLANTSTSKFYAPHTEYKDSLDSTPSGRALYKEVLHAALRAQDHNALDQITYKTHLYVFKDVVKSEITLYDEAGFLEFGSYTEPFSEQHWQIGDSIKQVLGYECQMAEMDYHGRHWTVWFATDIPLQDGPWKFHGLPGLILEASESSGQHAFVATGIEASDATMVPIYNKKKYAKMDRKAMLKGTRHALGNSTSMLRAQTGLDLGVSSAPVTEEISQYDFLETDYH